MRTGYDHIVIGAGVLGTATAYWLARSGATNILVLEQFELGHDKGASEDHSRVIRHVYDDPIYTALTHTMFDHWSDLEYETGLKLVTKTGGLSLVPAGSPGQSEVDDCKLAMAQAHIPYEELDAAEIRRRWPQWTIDDDVTGLFQVDGGILDIRTACAAQIARARARGVEFLPNTTVSELDSAGDRVTVTTDRGTFTAGNVVVCTASWTERLLPSLGLGWHMTLTQEQVSYFATPHLRDFAPDRFPQWSWFGGPERLYYGMPIYGEVAVKVSRDMSGRFISSDERSYTPLPEETELYRTFLRTHLPDAVGPELVSKTCVYDLPPDGNFILDRVPGHPRITIGIGAGHAAKFGNLLGHILSDITLHGATSFPVEPFRADRLALTDPSYIPKFRHSN
ncbi:sarcosine oxidase [Tamaricihabitans halophyticus]|uniref:Sarcosine oxidase n=1 Tax=Tamaricihabitans halophyticus TaxID=1262583 RepID=A0A4R2QDX1_9PSEU|nr:N-methyl-L-tryptophan oxidase [Tamaricihabitans halophyticus]TCP47273.1 sarcosine oxidase [Tamaricihabitans halophyticus]